MNNKIFIKMNAIKNVLLVSKTTRYERLLKKGINFTQLVIDTNKNEW